MAVSATADSELVEVAAPRRTSRRPTWSARQKATAGQRVLNAPGQWFSDGKEYRTRRQAYHKADQLVSGIHALGIEPAITLERKTQLNPETGRYSWAIRQRPKGS
jgi:hypothetical protein